MNTIFAVTSIAGATCGAGVGLFAVFWIGAHLLSRREERRK